MKLTRVEIDGVGRFGTTARIEGLGPGVNILAAGNEAGKSTFFRAIRACLFERHGTKNDSIRNLATDGLSLPVTVTLGFDHEGVCYDITKSFLKSPAASLKRNGVEIARNREADETLWEILGLTASSGRSMDEAAFGILWVSQGQSFQVPEPSEAATSALNAAIQQEVGTLVGGERARQVLASLNADLSRLLTEKGKPKTGGSLARATDQVEALTADLRATETRLAELDARLDDLASLRGEHKRLADPVETARLKHDLDEATEQLKAGEGAAAILQRCDDDMRQAEALLNAQNNQRNALHERRQRIDDNRERSAALLAELVPLADEEALASRLLTENLTQIGELDEELPALDERDRQLQRMASLAQIASSREGLSARLQALHDHETRFSLNDSALKANSVDEAAIKSLDAVERDTATLTAQLNAAAAQLSIERNAPADVVVNGKMVTANTDIRSVIEPISIMVGDEVTITITPPQSSLTSSRSQKDAIQQRLHKILIKHGTTNPTELRKKHADHQELEAAFRGLMAERTTLGLKDTSPAGEIARLSTEITRIDADTIRVLAESGAKALPSLIDLDNNRTSLREAREQLRVKRIKCETMVTGQNANLSRIATTRGTLGGQLKEIEGQLTLDLTVLPDDRRQEIIEAAERECQSKAGDFRIKTELLEEKRRGAPTTDEIDRLRLREVRLKEAINNRATQFSTLNQQIANLEGHIQAAGGDGLGERFSDLNAQTIMARNELARQTERIETQLLLREVVQQKYEDRREQLHAPLRRYLQPFLNDVFPKAELELGEGFAINGIKRSGPSSENFQQLSAGTQEQIAVLVRLAMGAMISDRGQSVPIILDDALVFSDDSRIEQMFDALTRAGQKQQVVVLTCRTRTFAALGGHKLSIESPSSP